MTLNEGTPESVHPVLAPLLAAVQAAGRPVSRVEPDRHPAAAGATRAAAAPPREALSGIAMNSRRCVPGLPQRVPAVALLAFSGLMPVSYVSSRWLAQLAWSRWNLRAFRQPRGLASPDWFR